VILAKSPEKSLFVERFWLYIVTFCKSEQPLLRIIQDPISKLNPEMLYRQVQFLVKETDWASVGEEDIVP